MQHSGLVVYHSHSVHVFSWWLHVHARLNAHVYSKKIHVTRDIPQYTTWKCCITTCGIYILLTKREGSTRRISARGLDSTDRAQRGPYKKDRGPIFSQYGAEQAWLIRDLLYDWRKLWSFQVQRDSSAGSFGTMPGPILREYWTGNRAFWLVEFSYWPSECLSRVIKIITEWCIIPDVSQGSWNF